MTARGGAYDYLIKLLLIGDSGTLDLLYLFLLKLTHHLIL